MHLQRAAACGHSSLHGSVGGVKPLIYLPSTRSSTRTSVFGTTKKKSKVGFRWDGANLRWVRDDRFADLATNEEATLIKPKTGVAYRAWPVVHTTLMDAGLKSIPVAEAAKLAKKGWTIVDVRLESDFEAQHADGAVNVPLYRFVQGDGLWDNLKRITMAGFAMKATERNPEFVKDALKVLKKNQKVLLMCAVGGTLETTARYRREKKTFNDPERMFGRESRSLKAAYELVESGWTASNILHVDGGFQQWRFDGFACDPPSEPSPGSRRRAQARA